MEIDKWCGSPLSESNIYYRNISYDVTVDAVEGETLVQVGGELIRVHVQDERERTASEVAGARTGGKRTVTASMPGVVVNLAVEVGDIVEDGQTLLILEAMKMQNPLHPGNIHTIGEGL